MARKLSFKLKIFVVASIITPTLTGNQLYVDEPPLQEEKSFILKLQVLIPFTIVEISHAFSGPFPNINTNVARVSKFSHCYRRTQPLAIMKETLDLVIPQSRLSLCPLYQLVELY